MKRIDLATHAASEVVVDRESVAEVKRLFEAGEEYCFRMVDGVERLYWDFYLEEVRETGKNHFLAVEGESVEILRGLEKLEMMGCGVTVVPVEGLREAIGPKTALLSMSAVCAMTGVMRPVEEILELCAEKGVKVLLDATHAMPTWGVSLKEWKVDYLRVGDGLFVRGKGRESVTREFVEEMRACVEGQAQWAMESARLKNLLEYELERAGGVVIGKEVSRVPHILAVSFPSVVSEVLMYVLHQEGVEVSMGEEMISMSLPRGVEEDDLAEAVGRIVGAVRRVQKLGVALE